MVGFGFFLFGSCHHQHLPFTQHSVVSESLLAPRVFSGHKGAASWVSHAPLAGLLPANGSGFCVETVAE